MRIFLSHADADKALASKFVDLLKLGLGVAHDEIFFSSQKGTIPNGEFFVQNIIKELNSSGFILALLSRSYFESHFCVAEAGAALARKGAGLCKFFSLVIPPAKFSDLDGMLLGVQSGSILERASLGDMKDRIQEMFDPSRNPPGSHIWDQKRDEFLIVANEAVSFYKCKDNLSRITVEDYKWQYDEGEKIWAHSKLRIRFKNGTGTAFTILEGKWTSGSSGIRLKAPDPVLKWQPKPGGDETPSLDVPAGHYFQTWVGLADDVDAAECLRRAGAKTTGRLLMKIKIDGQTLDHQFHF